MKCCSKLSYEVWHSWEHCPGRSDWAGLHLRRRMDFKLVSHWVIPKTALIVAAAPTGFDGNESAFFVFARGTRPKWVLLLVGLVDLCSGSKACFFFPFFPLNQGVRYQTSPISRCRIIRCSRLRLNSRVCGICLLLLQVSCWQRKPKPRGCRIEVYRPFPSIKRWRRILPGPKDPI